MKINDLALEELGGLVCDVLKARDIDAVLSGGSCVSVWTENQYVSNDLDMITTTLASRYRLSEALDSLGFKRQGNSRYYRHPESEFALEFPNGPIMVGDEQVPDERVHELATANGTLRLLSPTDCIKDRLAAFYHWKDRQSWEQAISVAKRHPPDWEGLKKWHVNEGEVGSFDKFFQEATAGDP